MKKMRLQLLIVCMLMAFSSIFMKDVYATEFHEITAEQLKAMLDAGDELLLINSLSNIEFDAVHIPGSVNIPLEFLLITNELPKNKNQLIVTYCLGRF